jgi:hypothetical protein
MNTPELIVWLIPGYLAVLVYRHVNPHRSKQGYEWFFQTAAAGLLCFIIARLLAALLGAALPGPTRNWVQQSRGAFLPFDFRFALTFLLALFPGWLIAAAALCLGRRFWDSLLQLFARIFRPSSYDVDLFLYRCRELEGKLIFMTLASNKVYVGVLMDYTENLDDPERFVVILPWRSGFRDKDTLQVTFTTDYAADSETLNAQEIIIPTSQVTSISKFDSDLDIAFSERGTTRRATYDELRDADPAGGK